MNPVARLLSLYVQFSSLERCLEEYNNMAFYEKPLLDCTNAQYHVAMIIALDDYLYILGPNTLFVLHFSRSNFCD